MKKKQSYRTENISDCQGLSGLEGNTQRVTLESNGNTVKFIVVMASQFYNFIDWLIFWLCWVFVAAQMFSSHGKWGLLSSWAVVASPVAKCQLLGPGATIGAAHRLNTCNFWSPEHRLSSCDARAYLLCSMWDPPRSGIEPVSPPLAHGFFTNEPPGKPHSFANMLKPLNYTLLDGWIRWYVNYASIKLLPKKKVFGGCWSKLGIVNYVLGA